MMRLIFSLLLLLVGGAVAFWLYEHPGQVSFEGFGYHVTTSLNVAIVLGLFGLLICRFFYGIIRWILRMPARLQDTWRGYQAGKDKEMFLSFFLEAMNHEAQRAAKNSEKIKETYKDDPVFTYLLGQSLLTSGHVHEAQRLFGEARHVEALKLVSLAGLANVYHHQHELVHERDVLQKTLEIHPQSAWALKRLYANLKTARELKQAQQILSRLEDRGYLNESQTKIEWATLYLEETQGMGLSDQEKEKRLRQAHFLLPESEEISLLLADALQGTAKVRQALDVLSTTWHLNPSQAVGDKYADLLRGMSSGEVYENLKKLTHKNSRHPESLLLLARYGLRAQRWDEARQLLLDLVETTPSLEVYALLAALETDAYGQKDQAYAWLQKGIEMSKGPGRRQDAA